MIKVPPYTKLLTQPKAGVRCVHKPGRKEYILDPEEKEPIIFVRAGALVARLDEKERVLSQDGAELKAMNTFYRTAETIDPYHVLLDMV
mgnify:CR=1 FL=1